MDLTGELRRTIDTSVLCWLSTVDALGRPNVSPKEIFARYGDDLVIAHVASPRSVRNLAANPQVCVSMIDISEQRGHKFIGTAVVVRPDQRDFPAVAAPLEARAGGPLPINAVIRIRIDAVEPIEAPSTWMLPAIDAVARRAPAQAPAPAPTGSQVSAPPSSSSP